MKSYREVKAEHGIAIYGEIPVNNLAKLVKRWRGHGYDLCDALVARHLGASLCVTTASGSTLWRTALGLLPEPVLPVILFERSVFVESEEE